LSFFFFFLFESSVWSLFLKYLPFSLIKR
jgi:hypothetical protein